MYLIPLSSTLVELSRKLLGKPDCHSPLSHSYYINVYQYNHARLPCKRMFYFFFKMQFYERHFMVVSIKVEMVAKSVIPLH